MNTAADTTVYSTSTTEGTSFEALPSELRIELGLPSTEASDGYDPLWDEADLYDEWCYVCSRPTDHRAEHDDLVERGLASYDREFGIVYSTR